MAVAQPDLAARAAIADVLALYCHAIDRGRWTLLDQLFHDEATYSFGPIDGSWREFVAIARSMIDPLIVTHHQLGQTTYLIDGSRASTETYMTSTHRIPADAAPGGAFPGRGEIYEAVIAGRYVDQFECRDGEWRITRREGIIDWRRDLPLPDGTALSQSLGPADPAATIPFASTRVSPHD